MKHFDGKALAREVLAKTQELIGAKSLSLGIFVCGNDAATEKFIGEKEKRGIELEVSVKIYELSSGLSTKKMRERISELIKQTKHSGYIVQLPLPGHINTQAVLNAVPERLDVDLLNQKSVGAFALGRSIILPPVVSAVKTLLESEKISLEGKTIAVVGAGRLVGRPIALWLLGGNLPFSVLTEESKNFGGIIKNADVIISGVGKADLITGDMIKEDAVIIDCGTSVEGSILKGDVNADSLKDISGWLAPVPGGVGPLTTAYIFYNLAVLSSL